MKKWRMTMWVVLVSVLLPSTPTKAQDPITLIIKAAVTKVIKAVDLKIQRLQNKTIWLQNAQKTLENTMSKVKLEEIAGWVEKQRTLYKDYFDELWKVKDAVSFYHKIRSIIEKQVAVVREYKRAVGGLKQDKNFTPEEVDYMLKVYTGIIGESLKNVNGISAVINSLQTQMTDAARMELVTQTEKAIQQNFDDLRQFTSQNVRLSLQRTADERDLAVVKALYGLQ